MKNTTTENKNEVIEREIEDAMSIEWLSLDEIAPYETNPRRNAKAVGAVVKSIKEFGFKVPIVIDKDGVIVCGHTRYKAARKLKLKTVPCVRASDLTDEQVAQFRIIDNKTAELAEWDIPLLKEEIKVSGLDEDAWGLRFFDTQEFDKFNSALEDARQNGERDDAYNEFEEKFKPKLTTDDCFTPPLVYEAVKAWAVKEYGWQKKTIVRPFYPNGDYQQEEYGKNCVVIDNPPFSIISEIAKWYSDKGIEFFLFAPHLTVLGIRAAKSHLCTGEEVIYENGAKVLTSFICSKGAAVRTAPSLNTVIKEAVRATRAENAPAELPKYKYPIEVLTATKVAQWSELGIEYQEDRVEFVRALDMQKEQKAGIFGSGYLAPAPRAAKAAEEARAAKAAEEARAAKAAEEARAAKAADTVWELSPREKEIVKKLEALPINQNS